MFCILYTQEYDFFSPPVVQGVTNGIGGMLLVLAQVQREHSQGEEILQGGVAGDGTCWGLVSIPTSRCPCPGSCRGQAPGVWEG